MCYKLFPLIGVVLDLKSEGSGVRYGGFGAKSGFGVSSGGFGARSDGVGARSGTFDIRPGDAQGMRKQNSRAGDAFALQKQAQAIYRDVEASQKRSREDLGHRELDPLEPND